MLSLGQTGPGRGLCLLAWRQPGGPGVWPYQTSEPTVSIHTTGEGPDPVDIVGAHTGSHHRNACLGWTAPWEEYTGVPFLAGAL